MDLSIKEQDRIKRQILDFTIHSVEDFLTKNPNTEFYAFAFDCNAEVNLCFNTEIEFQKTLDYYQTGEYSQNYKSEKDIKNLKYNTGDWEYQCFDTVYVLSESELESIFSQLPDDDYKSWNLFSHHLLDLFSESLIEFTQTETYAKIPKTKDFIAFCIDHDEEVEDAIERCSRYKV